MANVVWRDYYTAIIGLNQVEYMITRLNALVVEKRFITKNVNGNQEGKSEMILFELKNGKISKIFEYW